MLSSISGGTDVCSAFVGGCPMVPVVAGEISCRYLGAAVEAFDDAGHSVVGRQGELVITQPMPSMPIGFWGDDDGSRFRAAYFETYPGVWRHGDWITLDDKGSCVITGRSDATLNRGGVRIGTSEIYRVVETIEGVSDSLIVHLEDMGGGGGVLVLFLVLDEGVRIERGHRADPIMRCATACRRATCPTRSTPCRRYRRRCRARSWSCRSRRSSAVQTPIRWRAEER